MIGQHSLQTKIALAGPSITNYLANFTAMPLRLAVRPLHASAPRRKDARAAENRKEPFITYEKARHHVHVGVSKGWLTWNSQNLEGFRQQQQYTVAQDEVVRRFMRGFFPSNLIGDGDELVLKRRGNVLYVAGFLQYAHGFSPAKIYWMWGFAEEFLSNLLKQPVKLELQFVENEEECRYTYVDWTDIAPRRI